MGVFSGARHRHQRRTISLLYTRQYETFSRTASARATQCHCQCVRVRASSRRRRLDVKVLLIVAVGALPRDQDGNGKRRRRRTMALSFEREKIGPARVPRAWLHGTGMALGNWGSAKHSSPGSRPNLMAIGPSLSGRKAPSVSMTRTLPLAPPSLQRGRGLCLRGRQAAGPRGSAADKTTRRQDERQDDKKTRSMRSSGASAHGVSIWHVTASVCAARPPPKVGAVSAHG